MSKPILSIGNYSLSYATAQGSLRILDSIDLTINRSEVLGLVGESGSGKSSLAYAILQGLPGRVAEQQGTIQFLDNDLLTANDVQLQQIRGSKIAMVFQNAATALNPTQTLGEHVVEVLRRHRGLDQDAALGRTIELFKQVGLADPERLLKRYAHEISGGEKQRVVLATAFACDPDLILFDEPTSALDATTAASLLDLLRELQTLSGIAALFISHDLGVISTIAHRVAVIYKGQIVEQNSTESLFRNPSHPYTQMLLSSVPKSTDEATAKNADQQTVLQADNITVRFGRKHKTYAVNDVSIRLHRGETLGLVGESGCGKSSFARALIGLTEYNGKIVLDHETVTAERRLTPVQRQKIQIIFQNPDSSLNPRHRVGQLLERPLILYRRELDAAARKSEIKQLLERVRLPIEFANRYPHELSGGEKQRVAIARAIAAQPSVIVCDEITSGLDVSVQAAIIELLRTIQYETQVAMLFITHDLNVLRHIAHRVAAMYLGEIVEQRSVAGLNSPPYHPYTEALLSSVPSIDPEVEVRRVRLSGNLPTRSAQVHGCVFASRCPRRIDELCQHERPPQHHLSDGHTIVCQLSEQTLRHLKPIWQTVSLY